ncbi:carbohydrate-binding module family 32 [Cadophora sp. DSE1049]|nr:carbohydrate-binding module family 32 [Cadophora sp. DSE1049]
MKLPCAQLLLGTSIGVVVVNATSHYIHEAKIGERMSGYGHYDVPSWQPTFVDESPPHKGIRVPREAWSLSCSSDKYGYECNKAIDGSKGTAWRSDIGYGEHSITVDLRESYTMNAVVILPPVDTGMEGLITHHEIYVSDDEENWKGPVAYGMWPDTNRQRMSVFEPIPARYIKLTTRGKDNETWVGISELNIYATTYTIPQDPTRGVWGPTLDFPVVPVAGAQEASGQIIIWSSWASDQFHSTPGGQTAMSQWDPITKEVSKRIVTNTHHDMFCPGISIDGAGMMVVTGGNDASETSLYDAGTDSWVEGPPMHLRRGYQSSTTLSDGRVFVIGGSWSGGSNIPKDGEVYDPDTKSWTMLPDAKVKPMLTDDFERAWRADNHGWLFGWKNQTVFQAGPSIAMNWYYVEGTGSFEGAGNRLEDEDSMSGNAVMFDANGIMHSERVFIAGGQTFGVAFNEENVHFVPELYDPETDTFIQLQQNNFIRVYHSLSILLPDGRVFNGGGGLCGNCSANHYDAQIFTPPYLLTESGEPRPRPRIVSDLPEKVLVGAVLTFTTEAEIKTASLIRLCSASHTVNTDQRRIPLDLSRLSPDEYQYKVQLPNDPGIIIPGYWMVFVMDKDGVPSIAKTIMVTVHNEKTAEPPKELCFVSIEDGID